MPDKNWLKQIIERHGIGILRMENIERLEKRMEGMTTSSIKIVCR